MPKLANTLISSVECNMFSPTGPKTIPAKIKAKMIGCLSKRATSAKVVLVIIMALSSKKIESIELILAKKWPLIKQASVLH
jgi:hypothetical protein